MSKCTHPKSIGAGSDRHGNARRKCKICGVTFGLNPKKKAGRKPKGKIAKTNAEKQKDYRERLKKKNSKTP